MLLISGFHLAQPITGDVFYSLRPIFVLSDCFSVLWVRTANSSYQHSVSQNVFPLFQTFFFFTFPEDKLLLQFLGFALISGILGCLWFLGVQLHFRDASCTPQGRFWFLGRQAFSLSVFEQRLSSVQYFPPYNQVTFMAAPIISLKWYLSAKQKWSAAGNTAEFPHLNSPVCESIFCIAISCSDEKWLH